MSVPPVPAAIALTALAAALLVPAAPERRLSTRANRGQRGVGTLALLRLMLAVFVAGVLGLGLPRPLLVVSLAVALGAVAQVVLQRRQARRRAARRREVARACRVLAAQLRVGQVPASALRSAALDCPPLERAAAAQAIGADVAATLREAGSEPGYRGLVDLAMAWELAETAGAPIATLATRVSSSLRELEENTGLVTAELASPRASGRLLATLPLLGLALGTVAGGEPLRFLVDSPAGQICVLSGVGLAAIGVLWTERLADRAAR